MNLTVLSQAVSSGLLQAGLLAAVSVGLALVFGVMGVINFAHGALLMVAVYGALLLSSVAPIWVSTLVLAGGMGLVGILFYWSLIRPAYHLDHTFQLLITLGFALILENGALLVFGAEPLGAADFGPAGTLRVLRASLPWDRVVLFIIGGTVSLLLYLFLRHTDMGYQIRAAAEDADAAELVGIPVHRVMAISMGLGIAALGVVSPWLLATASAFPTLGDHFVLLAFVVVILGGLGSVKGAIVASLIVGLTQSLGVAYLPGTAGLSAVWILFVAILLFRPQGLFGGTHG